MVAGRRLETQALDAMIDFYTLIKTCLYHRKVFRKHQPKIYVVWLQNNGTYFFFRFLVNLATASGVWYCPVLSSPFTVTISRSCDKQFGSSLCLKWIVFLFSAGIKLSASVEQRVNVKFCVKLAKSATET